MHLNSSIYKSIFSFGLFVYCLSFVLNALPDTTHGICWAWNRHKQDTGLRLVEAVCVFVLFVYLSICQSILTFLCLIYLFIFCEFFMVISTCPCLYPALDQPRTNWPNMATLVDGLAQNHQDIRIYQKVCITSIITNICNTASRYFYLMIKIHLK